MQIDTIRGTFLCLIVESLLRQTKANFKINKLKDADNACKVRIQRGFSVHNLLAVFKETMLFADCLQVCLKEQLCASVNFVHVIGQSDFAHDNLAVYSTKRGHCILSGSNIKSFGNLHAIDQSVYATFSCKYGTEVPPAAKFHGTAPRQCGVKAFIHPPPSISLRPRNKRIIGGTKTPPYSQPWLGHVVLNRIGVCGISLIQDAFGSVIESSTTFAISAAHCFFGHTEPSFGFVFGVHDIRYPSAHSIFRSAERIAMHPDYDERLHSNDLALVKFDKKIRFNDYVRPICLPETIDDASTDNVDPPAGLACCVCGYGATEIKAFYDARISAHVPNCFTTKLLRLGRPVSEATENLIAAYYISEAILVRYKGISPGDSGSSVSCLIKNQHTLFGVVSAFSMSRLDMRKMVNIFIRIPFYINWVKCVVTGTLEVNNEMHPTADDGQDCGNLLVSCFKC